MRSKVAFAMRPSNVRHDLGGFSMSGDIRRSGGYNGDTVFAQLPEGRTLDELDGISVWCVPVATSFGDGLFGTP